MAKTEKQLKYEAEYKRIHGEGKLKNGKVEVTKDAPAKKESSVEERVLFLDQVIEDAGKQVDRNSEIKANAEAERTAIDPNSDYGVLFEAKK